MHQEFSIRHPALLMMVGCCLVALFNIDFTGTNIVFPSIISDFNLNLIDAQWINNVFEAAVAISFLVGTRICMVCELRETACGSMIFYALFCYAAGQADLFMPMLVYRGLMGLAIGVAYMAVFLIVLNVFPENKKGLAMGFIFSSMGIGMLAGPLIGAKLMEIFSWRSLFYINVPIALFISLGFAVWVPRPVSSKVIPLNALSIVLCAGITALLFLSLNFFSQGDFSLKVLLIFTLSLLGVVLLVVRERRLTMPMIPLAVFRLPSFLSGLYVRLIGQIYFIVALTAIPLYLINILNLSILHVGYYMTLTTFVIVLGSPVFGRLIDRCGARYVNLLSLLFALIFSILFCLLSAKDLNGFLFAALLVLAGLIPGANFTATSLSPLKDIELSQKNQSMGLIFTFAMFGNVVGLMLFAGINQQMSLHWLSKMHDAFVKLGLSLKQQLMVEQASNGTVSQSVLRAHLHSHQFKTLLPLINVQMMRSLKVFFIVSAVMALVAIWTNHVTMKKQ